jgi:UTP-glucose-1-phosphate uridylyltransferase
LTKEEKLMNKPTLAVMAAGMGSRYGGLKQIDPVGPHGEIIMDYSIYDAILAGFKKVVFIIKEDIKDVFMEKVGSHIEKQIETEYVYQRLDDIPEGISIPSERVKPWGTGHAVLSCRNAIKEPFAVINADDFYGRSTFMVLAEYLKNLDVAKNPHDYCMVGFVMENTLTENGTVARGVCVVDEDGYLVQITERTKIKKFGNETKYMEGEDNWITIPAGSIVSLNTWGFTPAFFSELGKKFPEFFKANKDNLLKAEYFLPDVVGSLIKEKVARVKVLKSHDKWYGVTYREDKPVVVDAIREMIKKGVYPENLWGN